MEADTWLVKPSWFDHGKPQSRPLPDAPAYDDQAQRQIEEPVLYVGHTPLDLRRENTLKRVYLDPIWEILERLNEGKGPDDTAAQGPDVGSASRANHRGVVGDKSWDWNGIYTDRGVKDQTLLFYIDVVSHMPSSPPRYPTRY